MASGSLLISLSLAGLLMNLKYYVSPYDLFEDGTGTPIILHENNGRLPLEAAVCLLLLEGEKNAGVQGSSLTPLCCCSVVQGKQRLPTEDTGLISA